MAIARVAHGTLGSGTNPLPGEPAGIATGDLLLCWCKTAGSAPTIGGEWTQEFAGVGVGSIVTVICRLWSFQYAGSSPNYQVTADGTNGRAFVVAYRPTAGQVIDVSQVDGHGTIDSDSITVDFDTLTPDDTNQMRVWFWGAGVTSGSIGAITGSNPTATEQLDTNGLGYSDGFLSAATATGARTGTLSGGAANLGLTVLLKEGTGASVVPNYRSVTMSPSLRMG